MNFSPAQNTVFVLITVIASLTLIKIPKPRGDNGAELIKSIIWSGNLIICAVSNYLWAVLKSRSPVKSLAKKINRHSKTGGLPGSSAATPNYQEIANRGESNAIK